MASFWARWSSRRPSVALDVLPAHESLRRMIADAHGSAYEAVESLGEAQAREDFAVVMQGDDGGSIHLTCPARRIRCDEGALDALLDALDARYWDDRDMARVFYERLPVGSGVAGGTGGGRVVDGVWLDPKLEEQGLRRAVEGVIAGERDRIGYHHHLCTVARP
jgi:hypothetical protein